MMNKVFFTIDNNKFMSLQDIQKTLRNPSNSFQNMHEINLESSFRRGEPGKKIPLDSNLTYTLQDESRLNQILNTDPMTADRSRKLLSVIQTNLAHQMSYYLSELALRKTDGSRNMAIVNFDQHIDFSPDKAIGCENWGYFSVCSGHTYISLLNKAGSDVEFNAYSPAEGGKTNRERGKISAIDQSIESLLPLLNNKALYVTVDIDVLKGENRTTFREGNVAFDVFCQILSDFLDHYKNDIVAVDIIGVPLKQAEGMKNYFGDINSLISLFSEKLN